MLERLIEYWLDSASERSYQPVFCQMLAAEGHVVVHSTRHAVLEFGKDIISLDKNGHPCAFQLKGNPGARLGLREFREVQAQLVQLVTQPIVFPGVPSNKQHRSFLVTNGYVDEEVQRAVDDLNRTFERQRFGKQALQIWSRGHLRDMAVRLGSRLWPAEPSDANLLLAILTRDGRLNFPIDQFHELLQITLRLRDGDDKIGADELKRRASSSALLTGVLLGKFVLEENHFAAIQAWTMATSYIIAATEKHNCSYRRNAKPVIDLAKRAIQDALTAMCDELIENPKMMSRKGIDFREVYGARKALIVGLMSLYWMWAEQSGWTKPRHKPFLEGWIPRDWRELLLWGEGAIPQFLCHYWYLSRTGISFADEFYLAHLLRGVLQGVSRPAPQTLASPYWTFDDVAKHNFSGFLDTQDPMQHETASRISFTATGLLHLLVSTNLKQTCKALWPEYTRVISCQFEAPTPWELCLWRSKNGIERQVMPSPYKQWNDLVDEARDCRIVSFPKDLTSDAYMGALFAVIFPHRATAELLRYLASRLGTVWFIPPQIVN